MTINLSANVSFSSQSRCFAFSQTDLSLFWACKVQDSVNNVGRKRKEKWALVYFLSGCIPQPHNFLVDPPTHTHILVHKTRKAAGFNMPTAVHSVWFYSQGLCGSQRVCSGTGVETEDVQGRSRGGLRWGGTWIMVHQIMLCHKSRIKWFKLLNGS